MGKRRFQTAKYILKTLKRIRHILRSLQDLLRNLTHKKQRLEKVHYLAVLRGMGGIGFCPCVIIIHHTNLKMLGVCFSRAYSDVIWYILQTHTHTLMTFLTRTYIAKSCNHMQRPEIISQVEVEDISGLFKEQSHGHDMNSCLNLSGGICMRASLISKLVMCHMLMPIVQYLGVVFRLCQLYV